MTFYIRGEGQGRTVEFRPWQRKPRIYISDNCDAIASHDPAQLDDRWYSTTPEIRYDALTFAPATLLLASRHVTRQDCLECLVAIESRLRAINVEEEITLIKGLPPQQLSMQPMLENIYGVQQPGHVFVNSQQFSPDGVYRRDIRDPVTELALTIIHELRHELETQGKVLKADIRYCAGLHLGELTALRARQDTPEYFARAKKLASLLIERSPKSIGSFTIRIDPARLEPLNDAHANLKP